MGDQVGQSTRMSRKMVEEEIGRACGEVEPAMPSEMRRNGASVDSQA